MTTLTLLAAGNQDRPAVIVLGIIGAWLVLWHVWRTIKGDDQ